MPEVLPLVSSRHDDDRTRSWRGLLARGVLALLLGAALAVVAVTEPAVSVTVVAGLFGTFAFLAGIAAACAAVLWPELTALFLILVVAAHSVVSGVVEIVLAVRMRKEIREEWVLVLAGVLSVAFGIALVLAPHVRTAALTVMVAVWAATYGALPVGLALRVRRLVGTSRE